MIGYFASHPTAANLLLLFFFAIGLMAAPSLERATFPEFSTDKVQVSIVYPGASPEKVEEAICTRIEDAIDGLSDFSEITCIAREGIAVTTIDLVSGADLQASTSEVRTEVEAITDFPDLVEEVTVRSMEPMSQVISIAINGPMPATDLKVYAEDFRTRLLRLPEISQATLNGFSDRQIRIALDAAALRRYRLDVDRVAQLVSSQNVDIPGGVIETGDRDITIRYAGERMGVAAYEDLAILGGATGAPLRLGEIATITDTFEVEEERVRFNGERAALITVDKADGEDTLIVRAGVHRFLEAERERAPSSIRLALTNDMAAVVEDRLTMLLRNAWQGLLLAFAVLWLFFSLRDAFWVTMGLPASFLGSLFILLAIDYSINMLTMVGLLIAIGLMMDDAIVITENIGAHRQRGKPALKAAVDGTTEVLPGVFSSFATSVCVFGPLAFLEGDIGRVLQVVPVVLIITLAVSLIEAFLILPNHLSHGGGEAPAEGSWRQRFEHWFERQREERLGRFVDAAVGQRYLTVGATVMVFLLSVAMVIGGVLKFQAFPDLDGDVVQARIILPAGTPFERTEASVTRITEALKRVDDAFTPDQPGGRRLVENVFVQYGVNQDAGESGAHLATVSVDLLPAEERNARVDDVLNLWRTETGVISDAQSLAFKEPALGPAGQAIEIRLTGDDLGELKAASTELLAAFGRYAGVVDLRDDLRPGKQEIRVRLEDGALALGLDGNQVARQLRAAFFGDTASEIQDGTESFEIDVQLSGDDQDLGDLDRFTISLADGSMVPLASVASIETARGFSQLTRIDGERAVTISGDVDTAIANTNEILGDVTRIALPELQSRYPAVRFGLEGESAEQATTFASMVQGFGLGIIGIFLLLSFQFRSYVEPIIVMVSIPAAFIGVIWGHLIMGLDLSMPSMLGFVSLSGVVVNDSILLVTFLKIRAGEGMEIDAAARQASRDRFRAVLLTSLTTIAGIAPLMFEQSLQAQVLVPLVTSLAFGIASSTFLVLILVPCAFAILHDFELTSLTDGDTPHGDPASAHA